MPYLQVLLPPVVSMMGLAYVLNLMLGKFHDTRAEQYVFGLMFGAMVVIGMMYPLQLGEGYIFDTRTLLIGSAVAFVGPIAGFIAFGSGLICRLIIGGAGMPVGVLGLVLAFSIAVLWCHFVRPKIKHRLLSDALFGCAISTSIAALLILPRDVGLTLLYEIGPLLIICNVVGSVAIGQVFRYEIKQLLTGKELEEHARRDPLTNLLNRRGLHHRIASAHFDDQQGHAMFYFDIDNFKHINDTYGHDAGDAALAIIAARLKVSLRKDAIFARHGGDEFSIYMPSVAQDDVKSVAERLGGLISGDKFQHLEKHFTTTISIGGYWTKQPIDVQDMIDMADKQLLLAKQAGKNRSQVHFDRCEDISSVA